MVRSDRRLHMWTPRRTVAVAVAVLLGAGCGSDPGTTSAGQEPSDPEPPTESSPFTVGPVAGGYRPVTAGTGSDEPDFGDDIAGTDEPYTVLSPDGGDGEGVVVVAVTGYAGQQGGLRQSSVGYQASRTEELTHDGREAFYLPADGDRWADLIVAIDDEVALRVASPKATRDELLAVADQVSPPQGHAAAPVVDSPGYEVVGSVDVDGVLAAHAYVQPSTDLVPGPTAAHGAGWVGPEESELAVLTVPGQAADLEAVATVGWGQTYGSVSTTERREVAGRPAVLVERSQEMDPEADLAPYGERTLWVETGWGDLLVVRSTGEQPLATTALAEVATSVAPTDQETWDAFVIEATGGPGLHPDEGRSEVARGTVGDVDWLLQDGPATGGLVTEDFESGPDHPQVDSCLKLSTRTRACVHGSSSNLEGKVQRASGSQEVPEFAIVSTSVDGAAVRITTSTEEATAPLAPVPGGGLWAAVVFVDGVGMSNCRDEADPLAPATLSVMRVEVLDAEGTPIACLGF